MTFGAGCIRRCGGILGGLVGITAGCGSVFPGSAIIIGSIAGLIYMAAEDITMKYRRGDRRSGGRRIRGERHAVASALAALGWALVNPVQK